MTTRTEIDLTLTALGGTQSPPGPHRHWLIPHQGISGTDRSPVLRVTCRVTRSRAYVSVDRWHGTDVPDELARPWLEEHVWPSVMRAKSNALPCGGSWTAAFPLPVTGLPALLRSWIDQELLWQRTVSPQLGGDREP